MANITINIPNGVLGRVIDALCYLNRYTDTIDDPNVPFKKIPNPVSKQEFSRKVIMDFVKNNVITYEARVASDTARDSAVLSAKAEIILS